MTVSLSAGAMHLLSPEGKMKKPLAFVTSLVICASLMAPLLSLWRKEIAFSLSLPSESGQTDSEAAQVLLTLTAEAVCRELEADVAYRYGIKEPHLALILDGSDPTAAVILSGTLSGEGEGDIAATYLSELLRCPVSFEAHKEEDIHGRHS
jgi:hypothetical protein